jgi:hypothetical protein
MSALVSTPLPGKDVVTNAVAVDLQGRVARVADEIEVWDIAPSLRLAWHAPTNGQLATRAAFSPDGSRLVVCLGGALTFWNAKTGDLLLRIDSDRDNFHAEVRWAGQAVYATNKGRVSVFNGSLDGLQPW